MFKINLKKDKQRLIFTPKFVYIHGKQSILTSPAASRAPFASAMFM